MLKDEEKAFFRAGDSTFYWITKSKDSKSVLLIGWRFLNNITYEVHCAM